MSKRKIIKKNKNINNIQVYNSDYEITQFIDNKEKFKIIESGSFKYDKWWQDILNKKFFVPSKKKNLLYVMTDHNDKNIENETIL